MNRDVSASGGELPPVPSKALEAWTGSLVLAGRRLNIRQPLTIIETQSGLTAAVAQEFELDRLVDNDGIRKTTGTHLRVMSVLRSGAMTSEHHTGQWNHPFSGKARRIDICKLPCTRRLITGDKVLVFPDNTHYSFDNDDHPSMYTPQQLLQEYMRYVTTANEGKDVFRPGNKAAMAAAKKVLEVHELLSPAANEAFGIRNKRAIGH